MQGKGSPLGIGLNGEGKSAPSEADYNERPTNWAERELVRPAPHHAPQRITKSHPTN